MANTVSCNAAYPDITESEQLYARATGLVPAYSQTIAKGPTQYVQGVSPMYLKRGKGCRVWDVDGNEYIDLNSGIGPLSLGYAYDAVDEAIKKQLADGIVFSLVHPLEVEAAELIREVIPNAEACRYSKTGAEVTSAAVRLARAYTKRDKVLCCGYHGWHDWFISVVGRKAGIPQCVQDLVFTFEYNDLDSVRASMDENTACVILEPMTFDFPQADFLAELKELCHANGSLLIFDEMWTGFRLGLGGAQEYFGVIPDLACYSKAIANGMPISVVTGPRNILQLVEDDVFFTSTFGGEALSLAATVATINELRDKDVPAYMVKQGTKLLEGYNDIATEAGVGGYTSCKGHPARTLVIFEPTGGDPLLQKSLVQQEMIKRGVLWRGFQNINYSHTDEDIAYVLDAYREVLPLLKQAIDAGDLRSRIQGVPIQPVFRKESDFNVKPAGQND